MIQAYSAQGKFDEVLQLFDEMNQAGVVPSEYLLNYS